MPAHGPSAKALAGALIVLGLLGGSFAPMLTNSWRAHRLGLTLAAIPLPEGARILTRSTRVFHSGNGAGCDYQGLMIVDYHGPALALSAALTEGVAGQATGSQTRTIATTGLEKPRFSAKVINEFTEISMIPNSDHAGLYLIALTFAPHRASLDPRCM
jgi:hypothetical protein